MSWQLRLFDLAAASQQAHDYVAACNYQIGFLAILGLKGTIPQKETATKSGGREELATYEKWYFEMMLHGLDTISKTIDKVRNDPKYKKMGDIPLYAGPMKAQPQEIKR